MKNIIISWKAATPQVIKNIRGGIMYAIGALLPFATFISEKLGISVADFSMYCGFAIIGVRFVSRIFGVPDEPAEDEKP